MNVFILDKDMEKSAQMLDDAHLKAQINEACQILMANWNKKYFPNTKIGHVNHPVTVFYNNKDCGIELFNYLAFLLEEYRVRFKKYHQNSFWFMGFHSAISDYDKVKNEFEFSKTLVNVSMTNNIEEIRNYIMTKPMHKKPTWTNREKPEWWVE